MFPELAAVEEKYRLLTRSLSDPALIAQPQRIKEVAKERAELEPLVRAYAEYNRVLKDAGESQEFLADPRADSEIRTLAEAELKRLAVREAELEAEIKRLLLPKDPYDEKNVLLEIRAGAGGDESSLFAQDLFRMYARFAEHRGWKFEVLETSVSPIGGFNEAVAGIQGKRVFSQLKYESGVHRVQRVP